ncbi:hypothetical protein Nepgr_018831 [Nepenthes gracilis]|uniref:Uncharacterized protein n=1 Tax=Nepenthes gracilis TaxID=150966 RepID=A0AAD3SU61_NEPGR|nr:hypothetical protein Nepgr_018831 [Nepenthes gracilis]
MAGNRLLHSLAIILAFSHLIFFNKTVPVAGSRSLMQAFQPSESTQLGISKEKVENRRMDMMIQDYPGSGANNRHTPGAQFTRGCVDC